MNETNQGMELFAWVGKGTVLAMSTNYDSINQDSLLSQIQAMANNFREPMRLVKFNMTEIVKTISHQPQ